MLEKTIQKLLLTFNPETAHRIAQHLINLRYGNFFNIEKTTQNKPKSVELFGLQFPNRVGLAAGWDKNAICFDALFRMGFGFVEVGTVTPKPQAGNPKPRVFRIPRKKALINRMGFNNNGVEALVEKIKVRYAPGILGVNIGKNKDTPIDNALSDYDICLKAIYPYADYVVVNISSPNTLGLRELQSARFLKDLLQGLQKSKKQLAGIYHRDMPLLVKTTVDLLESDYADFVQTLLDCEMDGVVISNTTIDHSAVENDRFGREPGGLSGAPLCARVTRMISAIHQISEKILPIVGVGGILTADDARAHYEAGAALLQILTGFVYRGPELISEILGVLKKVY